MKKLLMLSLTLVLSLSLVACSVKEKETEKESEATEEMETMEQAKAKILEMFNDVLTDVQPGSAGCSLKSTIVAVDFLNFYKEVKENEKTKDIEFNGEIFLEDFQEFFDSLSDLDKATFVEAWDMVYADINSMCGEGNGAAISEKLETAGCLEKGNYPWTDGESIEVFDMVNDDISEYVSNALAE